MIFSRKKYDIILIFFHRHEFEISVQEICSHDFLFLNSFVCESACRFQLWAIFWSTYWPLILSATFEIDPIHILIHCEKLKHFSDDKIQDSDENSERISILFKFCNFKKYFYFLKKSGCLKFDFSARIRIEYGPNVMEDWMMSRRHKVTFGRFLGLSNMYKTFGDDIEKLNMMIDSISETMILKMVHLRWFLDNSPHALHVHVLGKLLPCILGVERLSVWNVVPSNQYTRAVRFS